MLTEENTNGRALPGRAYRLAILGPGRLGLALARWAAERGLEVRLAGRDPEHAQRALAGLQGASGALADIHPCNTWEEALEGAQAVLEALPEDQDAKAAAWRRLAPLLGPTQLPLTASSSLSVAALRRKAGLERPLLAFHPFLPLHRMHVVEVSREADCPPSLLDGVRELARLLAKRVVLVQDQPGYAASRMALAQGLEAMRLLESGAASAEDLDALMVLGYGHPCGPLELSDRIGLDLRLAIAEQLHTATGEDAFRVPAILREKVAQGKLGRKSGEGFHEWKEGIRVCVQG